MNCKAKEMHASKKSLKAARDFSSGEGVHSTNVVNFSAVIPFGTLLSVQYIFQFGSAVPSSVIYKFCVGKPLNKLGKHRKINILKHCHCSDLLKNWITVQSCPSHAMGQLTTNGTNALWKSENLNAPVSIALLFGAKISAEQSLTLLSN